MKNYLKSVVVISAAALLSIASGCGSDKANNDVEATCGDVRIDPALHVADSIGDTDEPDPDKLAKALDGLAKAATESKSEPASAVAKMGARKEASSRRGSRGSAHGILLRSRRNRLGILPLSLRTRGTRPHPYA